MMAATRTITLKFPRATLSDFPARLRAHARKESDATLRKRLEGAAQKFEAWLAVPGEKVCCEAPFDAWAWLAGQCIACRAGAVGAAISAALARIEAAPAMRQAKRELLTRGEAICADARAMRQREGGQ